MRQAKRLLPFACLLLCAVLAASAACAAARFDLQKVYGPRIERLCMVIITNPDAQVLAAELSRLNGEPIYTVEEARTRLKEKYVHTKV